MKFSRKSITLQGMLPTDMKKQNAAIIAAFILPIVAALICIGFGRYSISVTDTIKTLLSPITRTSVKGTDYTVIFNVRLPRIILALFVGMGLSLSGTAFQALFSNPLATPDTLGVASGASFGAVLVLLFDFSLIGVQVTALIFGLIALILTYAVSKIKGQSNIVMIVLGGIVISSLFEALVSFIKYIADPQDDLPAISYWLMGSMSSATYNSLRLGLPFIIAGSVVIILLRWRLNIVSLNDDEARSLGGRITLIRILVMVSATMITASAVSMCGQVGWVGLLVPHIAKFIVGNDNRKVVLLSIGFGASFMVAVDTVARSLTASELPLSVLTALIGAPFFVVLLRRIGGLK